MPPIVRVPESLRPVFALSHLLERMEQLAAPVQPDAYRAVVERLRDTLAVVPAGEILEVVLGAFPGASEIYENLHYAHAGLCRSALGPATEAEADCHALWTRLGVRELRRELPRDR